MEKIININFQGRVIPIEETAYNNLKQYIDSLRKHFAAEESSDEIIHDIENRVAELFSERLKRGASCIMSSDVNAVIDSIGRLEDIEAAEGDENPKRDNSGQAATEGPAKNKRFTRNTDDKIIAGVCSGIANSTGIDPVIVRVLAVLLFGALFWVYILLWIIVPAESQQERLSVKRRLYRNPDDKVIAGVCGGLAAYFKVESWKPRLVFALPLLFSILSGSVRTFWWHWGWHWGWGPRFFTGSFTGTMLISYIILWVVLPKAKTPVEKLAMRGEKIDMNTIKAATQAKSGAGAVPAQRTGSGAGRVIGIIFKAFFLFIAGTIALSLFGVFMGLLFAGTVAFPFTGFFLNGGTEYALAAASLVLCLGIPMLALVTWIIRRLMGIHSRRHLLGFMFAGLWIIGFFSVLALVTIFMKNFSTKSIVEEPYALMQPTTGKLYIDVSHYAAHDYTVHKTWFIHNHDDERSAFRFINGDSLLLNTVKVRVVRSADSLYHIYEVKSSRGSSAENAKDLASHINFNIAQQDSMITLPGGFAVSNKDKFRNQQVQVMIEVPLGKKIQLDDKLDRYDWFNIHSDGRSFNVDDNGDDEEEDYETGTEYIMTPSGLKSMQDSTTTAHHTEYMTS
jgi:phage shock protein PspC (stress-responsive transcriptional regulator)